LPSQLIGVKQWGLRLIAKPFDQVTQADHIVAMVVHGPTLEDGYGDPAGAGKEGEGVLAHGRVERSTLLLPVGDEFVQRDGIDHGTRKYVSAHLGGLFHHTDADFLWVNEL